jgi:hypothetical protein
VRGEEGTMSVSVEFADWGPIYLAPGAEELRWFTWARFDPVRWSAMYANPRALGSPSHDPRDWTSSSIQIVEQWSDRDGDKGVTTHWCRIRNRGSSVGLYHPQAIAAPA